MSKRPSTSEIPPVLKVAPIEVRDRATFYVKYWNSASGIINTHEHVQDCGKPN